LLNIYAKGEMSGVLIGVPRTITYEAVSGKLWLEDVSALTSCVEMQAWRGQKCLKFIKKRGKVTIDGAVVAPGQLGWKPVLVFFKGSFTNSKGKQWKKTGWFLWDRLR
jgi:hypothetical protein